MTDLVSDTPQVAQSPKRKFSFRFPNLSHHSSIDKTGPGAGGVGTSLNGNHSSGNGNHQHHKGGRNFSEELKNVPDLQVNFIFIHFIYYVGNS